ncbi:MAG: hypothetical protein AAGD88_10820 [Bacteroidota bacterium]
MKRIPMVFLSLVLMCTYSCNLDDDEPNFHFTTLSVVSANLPDTFDLFSTYVVEVTYLRPNSCTFFEGFDVSGTEETERVVAVIGTVITDSETACNEQAEEVTASFRFRVNFTEDYTFRFYTGLDSEGNGEYIEYTVPVTARVTN